MSFFQHLRQALGLSPGKNKTEPSNQQVVDTIVEAVGGLENIRDVFACISRLRLSLHDTDRVDEALLKTTGCYGLIPLGPHKMHVVYGLKANAYSEQIQARLEQQGLA